MKVTIKNFFAKSVTLEYPNKKQPMTDNFRGMVDLKPEACVICYQCIKICPTAALYLSHKQKIEETKKKNEITKFTFNAELCCFCGLCDEICPTDAIFMNKMYEVSAFSHNQIVSIDLMDEKKYTHLDPSYDLAYETKRNEDNTVGKAPKVPAPAAAPAPVTPPASPTVTPPTAVSTTPAAPISPAATTTDKPVNPEQNPGADKKSDGTQPT